MPPTTENHLERIREIRQEVLTINDPWDLLADFVYENERLREQITHLKSEMCQCA